MLGAFATTDDARRCSSCFAFCADPFMPCSIIIDSHLFTGIPPLHIARICPVMMVLECPDMRRRAKENWRPRTHCQPTPTSTGEQGPALTHGISARGSL